MESKTKKILIGIGTVVLLAVAGFSLWFFVFRDTGEKPTTSTTSTTQVEQPKSDNNDSAGKNE